MYNKLIVSPSPHEKDNVSTASIMLNVCAALVPAAVVSSLVFGFRSLIIILVSVTSAMLSEFIFTKINHLPNTVGDFSAAVTGMLLAFNLPASIPLWMAALGSAFAIIVVKELFGGIGDNFANPAIVGRIFLFLSFSGAMSNWVAPYNYIAGELDAFTGATPLYILTNGGRLAKAPDMLNMLLGIRGGCLGETAAIALLIGGIYLIYKRVITPTIPVTVLGTIFVMSLIVGQNPFYMLVSGGTMLGAFFMATDYVTSPTSEKGKFFFGLGVGIITMLIRAYARYPEGMSFAILLMNIVTPHIDNLCSKSNTFGGAVK